MKKKLQIFLASPRGFCAGVDRAILIVEKALEKHGSPVYVRHEIVHNKYVVDSLKAKGAIFVQEIDEIPVGAVAIFSAHGVADKIEDAAREKSLNVLDATCPLVTKVHLQAQKYERDAYEIIVIGHEGHPEVIGTSGKVKQVVLLVSSIEDARKVTPRAPDKLAYVTQTTLSVDDTKEIINVLKGRFPNIAGPETKDICYATQNRQNAVKELAPKIDMLLVVGGKNSSNSNRLRDLGQEFGVPSYLIDDAGAINKNWLEGVINVGITAGASAPQVLVDEIIDYLGREFDISFGDITQVDENMYFKLPRELA